MLSVVAGLLERIDGDTVLQTEYSETLLVRIGGNVTANQKWNEVDDIREVFPGCDVREFPDL